MLHPKNSNRVEAVKIGVYKEINDLEEARTFICSLLESNLKTELMGIETECKN